MNLPRAIEIFRKNFVGKEIRRQVVEFVEIIADTNGHGGAVRYFAVVVFRENPPTNESPEMNVLQGVFSEIPPFADVLCSSWPEVQRLISGQCPEAQWRLEDEPRPENKET